MKKLRGSRHADIDARHPVYADFVHATYFRPEGENLTLVGSLEDREEAGEADSEGFYVAAGFSGHGFKLSPTIGDMMAEWITTGGCREFDIARFRASRFAEGDLIGGLLPRPFVGTGLCRPGDHAVSNHIGNWSLEMSNSELCDLRATELALRLRQRRVSPVEIVEALLRRIESRNDTLRAYLYVDAERAMAAARAAEIEIGAGGYRGPLHGVPVAYKDIYDVQGLPTSAASKLMADYVAAEDCTVAARLRQAGAICLGKLNTLEFASGSMEVFGTARNPWNTDAFPGGSSSGSGVALAAHLIPLATGSDTGGSVRNPASFCGIVGLKPTYGRISRAGIIPLSWSLDHAGPMARTVADTALLLRAMAGPDQRDPSAAVRPVPDYASALTEELQGVRLGVPHRYFFEAADAEVVTAVHAALDTLRQLGAEVCELDVPHAAYGSSASWAIAYTESFAFHRAQFLARSRDYTPAFLHKISGAACLTAEERVTAQRLRQVITAEFREALCRVDAIVTPTTAYAAHPIGAKSPQADMHSLTRPVSLTGLPALAVPCGFTGTGLPISLQLIGRAWEEATVLRIGHAYEQAAGWYRRRPPIAPAPLATTTPPTAGPNPIDARWVLSMARLTGLDFITEADAAPIAASIGPVKAQLAEARQRLDANVEPPVRPAPTW